MLLWMLLMSVTSLVRSWSGRTASAKLFQLGRKRSLSSAVSAVIGGQNSLLEEPVHSGLLKNFITNIIDHDIATAKYNGRVVTRFPPEPNGYLHLGHAKSVNLNFGVATAYKGVTHMRFDDTNPTKEDMEYVRSILDDVRWLTSGNVNADTAPWHGQVRHASDYFEMFYNAAEYLVVSGNAYVDDLSSDEMKEYRGTLTSPGRNSPFRDRSVAENLQLFRAMKNGEFADGSRVLRAKIDMASGNINMRDPALYRIKRGAVHPITGSKWNIYPMYDFAHALSDAVEEITHSLCTLEFADHRPLYDWCIQHVLPSGLLPTASPPPHQYEFSRLNLQYTVLSKRKLIQLVQEGHVSGWDDPRMPTICGLRRRGVPHTALSLFCDRAGISKVEQNIDLQVFEDCVRDVLDHDAPRAFGIEDPIRVTITNWPSGSEYLSKEGIAEEVFNVPLHPKRPEMGNRSVAFGPSVYISRSDFFDTGPQQQLTPPKGFKRLTLGGCVRLRFAYVITCDEVIRDPSTGEVQELRCRMDVTTRAGATSTVSNIKAKGIVQWVAVHNAVPAQFRLYDRLFVHPSPGSSHADGDFRRDLNPKSLEIIDNAVVEASIGSAKPGVTYQFERVGYFTRDSASDANDKLVFNRVVTLKDTWANKITGN